MGIVQVLEGRRLFEHLTTEENLRTGALINSNRTETKQLLEEVYEYFPALKPLRNRTAGYLSGVSSKWWLSGGPSWLSHV